MNVYAVGGTSDYVLIWLAVALATAAVLVVAVFYFWMALEQAARIRYGLPAEAIRQRHASHRPYLLPINMAVVGAAGSIICWLLQRMKPVLPDAWSLWICLAPLTLALLSAAAVLAAIRMLRRALHWARP